MNKTPHKWAKLTTNEQNSPHMNKTYHKWTKITKNEQNSPQMNKTRQNKQFFIQKLTKNEQNSTQIYKAHHKWRKRTTKLIKFLKKIIIKMRYSSHIDQGPFNKTSFLLHESFLPFSRSCTFLCCQSYISALKQCNININVIFPYVPFLSSQLVFCSPFNYIKINCTNKLLLWASMNGEAE